MDRQYSPIATKFLEKVILTAFADQQLRDWFIEGTVHETVYKNARSLHKEQALRRGPMKGPFFTNYWWGKKIIGDCRPKGSEACEIDAMMFLQSLGGRVLAIHIEHKRKGESFDFGQAEAYPMRAARFAEPAHCPKQILPHDDWMTLIFCDESDLGNDSLSAFQRKIVHTEALARLGQENV